MRPDSLFTLFSDVTRLKGVGPGARKALGRLFGGKDDGQALLKDVIFHLPISVVDRRNSPTLAEAKDGDIVTFQVRVLTHHAPVKRYGGIKHPYKIQCWTEQGALTLVFFHARSDHLATLMPAGQERIVSGKFERFQNVPQIMHPDIVAFPSERASVEMLEPVYPLTGGLTNRHLRKIIDSALALLPKLPEWLDAAHVEREKWTGWNASVRAAHLPETPEALTPSAPARRRLAYDELLANQLALALLRSRIKKPTAAPIPPSERLRAELRAGLPYALTRGQEKVIAEIDADLASGLRMLRLLQGDVGSGKTITALCCMLSAVEASGQAALMAPTELLARQHYASIIALVAPLGLRTLLLTGSMKPAQRAAALEALAADEVDIVIGTHALFQDKVVFRRLLLAVIDEQHRFGVNQRMQLAAKSADTHVLVMTATPIPRSLAMTAFGDMDASILDEKPLGRLPIKTSAVPIKRVAEVLEGVERAMAGGEKVYWICPLVEESDEATGGPELSAVEMRHKEFLHRFGERVGLAHGRMSSMDRDKIMAGFAGDAYDMLVATTVVEVGVDVPAATVIIIEHAERFGLAQLHQLRGRVGRSDKRSACILLYADRPGEIAQSRLRVLRETNDGFRIAEDDLKLRGAGDVLGTRQSGLPAFRFADLSLHYDLLSTARADARLLLAQDAALNAPRGQAARVLLSLFGYDDTGEYRA